MSNPFAFPYLGRIVGRLPGHDPIELFRPVRGLGFPSKKSVKVRAAEKIRCTGEVFHIRFL